MNDDDGYPPAAMPERNEKFENDRGEAPAPEAPTHEGVASKAYVRSVVDPARYHHVPGPPTLDSTPNSTQRFDGSCKWTVDDAALQGPGVTGADGAVLWMCERDVTSVYRLGFIPTGTILQHTDVAYSAPYVAHPHSFGFVVRALSAGTNELCTMTFGSPTPIAYRYNSAGNGQVYVSPAVDSAYRIGRVVAGVVTVKGTQLVIGGAGAAVMGNRVNGTMTASSVVSVRSVYSTIVNGSTRSFDEDVLTQQCAVKKDIVDDVSASHGVAFLVGPDISPSFQPVYQNLRTFEDGCVRDIMLVDGPNRLPRPYILKPDSGMHPASQVFNVFSYFITPFAVTLDTGAPDPYTDIRTTSITVNEHVDPTGHFDLEFTAHLSPWFLPAPEAPVMNCLYNVNAMHYIGHANVDGSCEWYSYAESKPVLSSLGVRDEVVTFKVSPSKWHRGLAHDTMGIVSSALSASAPQGGTYFGTHVTFSCVPFQPLTTGMSKFPEVLSLTLSVIDRSCNARGVSGPARVLRYSELSQLSAMSLSCALHVQGVPLGDVVPFMDDVTGGDAEMNPALPYRMSRLFAVGDCPIRRVWDLRDYVSFLEQDLISTDQIVEWLTMSEDEKERNQRKRMRENANDHNGINQRLLPWGRPEMMAIWRQMEERGELHLTGAGELTKPKYLGSALMMSYGMPRIPEDV